MIKSWLFHDFLEVWGFLLSPKSHSGNEKGDLEITQAKGNHIRKQDARR